MHSATMSRYEFLQRAHEIIRPSVYLEVGVQTGASLALAEAADVAVGVDPEPVLTVDNRRPNQHLHRMTSGGYFAAVLGQETAVPPVNLAYIDGSHLFEDALWDFIEIERLALAPRGVILFDDVLPYGQAIAARVQPPGDWTGDVWKVAEILAAHRPDLSLHLIDVAPTGLLLVQHAEHRGIDGALAAIALHDDYDKIVETWLAAGEVVPNRYILREPGFVISAAEGLDIIKGRIGT